MATAGNTTTPSTSYHFSQLNTQNAVAYGLNMPQAGLITSISCYFDAQNGHGNTIAALCLWQFPGGTLIAQSNGFTLTPGSGSTGGQQWWTQTITSPSGGYLAANGQQIYLGWWRFGNGTSEWSQDASATVYLASDSSNSNPPSSESFSSQSGLIGAYITYTPLQAYVRRSGAWVAGTPQVRRSGAWVAGTPYVRRSGVWVPGG